jgi:hypothetical protein
VGYQLKAELSHEQNALISSYSFEDNCRVAIELLLIFYIPFNRDYATLIADNLYKQLTIGLEKDLRKGAAK